ncbi:MAG: ABC transporter ATP-binding protein [Nitrososphaerota archaeon]
MTTILLEKLRKEYGDLVAVNDLTLKVEDKSFVSLLGPSGCGKTTTLKMLAGLLRPTSGRIYFDENDVTDLPPKDRRVGLVFQDYAIFTHMTAYENVAYGLKLKKLSKPEIDKEVKTIAEFLNIHQILDKRPYRMTQRELQMVALARTLVTKPSILLLDEPLSNLDAAFRVKMRAELRRLQMEIKQTVVYVTHDQIEAMAMSDKIAVMNLGILQQYGTPDEIYMKPANRFVAGFIGTPPMNFIDCTYKEEGGKAYLDQGSFRVDVTPLKNLIEKGVTGPDVILGVRPEDLKLHDKPFSKEAVEVTVEAYEPMGSECIVYAKLGHGYVRITAPPAFKARPNEKKYVTFNLESVHVMDRKTEKCVV